MKKQQKENEEIARIIEREQIISYKKKPSSKLPKQSDDEIESAHSLKSGVFSEENSSSRTPQDLRFSKKNTPLPQLNRQKRRFLHKNMGTVEPKQINNYLQKEVRQHDNLVLKQKNNHLTTENMKLKTKIMTLEKQNQRLSKLFEEQSQKPHQPGLLPRDNKFKGSENLSLKMTIKNLRKELDDQKKQNQKIKWSIKFTRINELECERDEILSQTARLRFLLEEEMSKRVNQKVKEHGLSHLQQKIHNLGQRNMALMRENNQLQLKLKKVDDSTRKSKQTSENQKNLNRMLSNAKKIINERQKEIQILKTHSNTEVKIESTASIGRPIEIKSSKEVEKGSINRSKQKKVMSKSAQKYRRQGTGESMNNDCQNCKKQKDIINALEKKIEELSRDLKTEQEKNGRPNGMGDFRREQIEIPTSQEVEKLSRYLTFRFKAHHLSFDQAEKYLVNGQINDKTLGEQMGLGQLAESLISEPFAVISSRYLEIFLTKIFYKTQCSGQGKVKLDEKKKIKKEQILVNFRDIVKPYQIMPQQKEEQMFIQIAELVTNYHQHILTALNRKRNGEGTINETDLVDFFNEIQLEKEFTDFIISQIILESLDLEHLNFYTMFQIFYMPTQGGGTGEGEGAVGPDQPNKKKFQVDHAQIVKEEDEEYEESRSYVQAHQKTQSRRDDDLEEEQADNSHHKSEKVLEKKKEDNQEADEFEQKHHPDLKSIKKEQKMEQEVEEQQYQQNFEEEKMDQLPEQQKADEDPAEEEIKPYLMEEVNEEYQDDDSQKAKK